MSQQEDRTDGEKAENQTPASDDQPDGSGPTEARGPDAAGLASQFGAALLKPDQFFTASERGWKQFGLISIGAFLILVYLQSAIARMARLWSRGFEFGHITHGFTVMLAVAIPLVATIFIFRWLGSRENGQQSLDFYIEKMGGALVLPSLLLLISIPLNLMGAAIGGWTRAAALIMVYVAVFFLSHQFAAPNRLRIAAAMTLGFYFGYRLLLILF